MTASADITVIPTGGMTPINLADLAAAVLAVPPPQLTAVCAYHSGSSSLDLNVKKQTGWIEESVTTIDGNPFSVTGFTGVAVDGAYGGSVASVPSSAGEHVVLITLSISGKTATTSYTI